MQKKKRINLMDNLIEPISYYSCFWEDCFKRVPKSGKVGISYFKTYADPVSYTHTLVYRNGEGKFVGFFEHFPIGTLPDINGKNEEEGNINIWVDPKEWGKGIGTALLTEACKRWDINIEHQQYTALGYKLVRSYMRTNGYEYYETENIEKFLNHYISLSR
jgi:GNAT superfamily N-acetyltransferase